MERSTAHIPGERIRFLNEASRGPGPVVYWMQRDQRVGDNWALYHARERARAAGSALHVVFVRMPSYLGARAPHYLFMMRGLREVAGDLGELGIGFHLLEGTPEAVLPGFCRELEAGLLVSDYSPLREPRLWREAVAERVPIAHHEVDAHNVIPPWVVSAKREFAARTLRPKIHRMLAHYRRTVPAIDPMPASRASSGARVDWDALVDALSVAVPAVPRAPVEPGARAAQRAMGAFLDHGLPHYDRRRNDPNAGGQSGLSPYLHFGQLGAGRLIEELLRREEAGADIEAFLEEALVRRELSENFCHYEPRYDRVEAFPQWAKKTLQEHAEDTRDYLYAREEFEAARTHDPLWNAAQRELVVTGKMHGYMRMYWAKKILEWTTSPSEAMEIAIALNDAYSFDGRDPNGYAGIAWSIGGVHDRAFAERRVFGKVRFMNERGSRRKFDVDAYVAAMHALEGFPFEDREGS